MIPNVVTEFSEHFKNDAKELKEKFNFTFAVIAYRKLTKQEMTYAFQMWKRQQKSIPTNKSITIKSIIGSI